MFLCNGIPCRTQQTNFQRPINNRSLPISNDDITPEISNDITAQRYVKENWLILTDFDSKIRRYRYKTLKI